MHRYTDTRIHRYTAADTDTVADTVTFCGKRLAFYARLNFDYAKLRI